MGEKDVLEKTLFTYEDVFADIVNNLIFNGKEQVREEDLETTAPHNTYQGENGFRELERDAAKYWKNNDIRIALLGLENESQAENDMPVRVIGYDGASYRDQIRYETDVNGNRKKIVNVFPVVTLVLYFNYEKHWDKPKTLHQMLGDKLLPELKSFVPDYPINLFEIAWLSDEQVKGFKSDFQYVADYFVQMRKTGRYTGSRDSMKHVREVLRLMSRLTGDVKFAKVADDKKFTGARGGNKSMGSALDYYWNKGVEQGEDRHLIEQICKKLRRGMDIEQIADEVEEDISRVQAICNTAEEYAPDYELDKVLKALHADVMA